MGSPHHEAARLLYLTGAASGIGQALALRHAARGGRLALVARRVDAVRAWLGEHHIGPDRAAVYQADVRDVDAIVGAGQACIQAQGLPDFVIANAGVSIGVDTGERADLEIVRELFDTHCLGMAATFQPFIHPMWQRRRGTLVGIASMAAIRGLPGHAAYCGSKAAVLSYCESLRGECRPHGVRVVTLLPGYIDTSMTRGNPYPMPFLMAAEAFAEQAWRAIERGDSRRVIPWQMAIVAKLLRLLPNPLFDRVLAGRGRKPRRVP